MLFANFAEAIAEGRGRARADSLRATQRQTTALRAVPGKRDEFETVPAQSLRAGDLVRVVAGELIPGDGDVERGIASVDESALTGESAPVIREAGSDRSGVTGGTRVVSDQIDVRISADAGHTYLDKLIGLVKARAGSEPPTRSPCRSCSRASR